MSATATGVSAEAASIAHPDGVDLHPEPDRNQRLVGWLFAGAGLILFAVMGLVGLTMRLTQAEVLDISNAWFYRLMTLHGAGMLAAAMLAMMGGLWYVIRASVPLSLGRILVSLASILAGAVAIVVAVIVGGFAAGWTFLSPLPFDSAGEWGTWATVTFLSGMVLVGVGFFIYCIDVLAGATAAYGGLPRALGIPFLRGRDPDPPPPQVIAATVVSTQGLLASTVGTTILMALLGRTIDGAVALDALWAKNLTYFFGHSFANLIIYLGAGMVYVLLPRYAGRPWKTTKPIVIGWLATLLLVTIAYSHHLYMDFVQPRDGAVDLDRSLLRGDPAGRGGDDLHGNDARLGIALQVDARLGPHLSRLCRLGHRGFGGGDRLADPGQPPLPQHALGAGSLPHLPDARRDPLDHGLLHPPARAGRRTARLARGDVLRPLGDGARRLRPGRRLVRLRRAGHPAADGGPPPGHPRLQPGGQHLRDRLCDRIPGAAPRADLAVAGRPPSPQVIPPLGMPRIAGAAPEADRALAFPLATPRQIGVAVGAAVACGFVFLPEINEAAEAGPQFHHLQHSVQFLMGAALAAAVVSSMPRLASLGTGWRNAGLAAVILSPRRRCSC